jgi:hypothetical protein
VRRLSDLASPAKAALIVALAAEHAPQGPTEEHLVEELAGVVWRKRRLQLARNFLAGVLIAAAITWWSN